MLPASESHHALTVLRLRPGDAMTVTDGAGTVARGELTSTKGDRAVVSITSSERLTQPRPQLIVYQGAAKGHKLDLVVERLAELGVAELWAFTSERSVVRWDHDKAERATQRWQSIAESSSKQSRSAFTLRAGGVLAWPDLLARIRQEPSALVFWEEAATAARAVLPDDPERVALVVGPEGGLTPAEALALEDVGAPPVSLGPRILRTENAAAVAVAAVLWHYGLIG